MREVGYTLNVGGVEIPVYTDEQCPVDFIYLINVDPFYGDDDAH